MAKKVELYIDRREEKHKRMSAVEKNLHNNE